MGRQQAQFPHAGLQIMGAFDMIDCSGKRCHLLDPGPGIGTVEVLRHPPAQIDGFAYVEHLTRWPPEQVNARGPRQAPGEMALTALRWCHVRQIRAQLGVGVHALVADTFDEAVQHVDGGTRVIECAVGGRTRRAEEPGERRTVARWGPRPG